MFSGFSSVSTVPAGSASNAAFTGANTVNGPLLCSVSTRPAAFTAATSVVWSLRIDRVLDDVLLRKHGAAADHDVGSMPKRGKSERDGARGADETID